MKVQVYMVHHYHSNVPYQKRDTHCTVLPLVTIQTAEIYSFIVVFVNLNHSSSPPAYHEPFQDEVLTVVERVVLSPTEICGFVLGSSCAHFYNPFKQEWNVTVPGNKPPVVPVPPPKV